MEKLCIFCEHFSWEKESMWGMGSTMTGPMMDGGQAKCAMGKFPEYRDGDDEGYMLTYPEDESEYRKLILRGQNCDSYSPVG